MCARELCLGLHVHACGAYVFLHIIIRQRGYADVCMLICSFQLQGCLAIAALSEVCIGLFGIVGFMMRYIGPVTVAPTIMLIGISMSGVAAELCAKQWWIAIMLVTCC